MPSSSTVPTTHAVSKPLAWLGVGPLIAERDLLYNDAMRIYTRLPLEERFWKKVVKGESCWLWTGAVDGGGYGKIATGGTNSPLLEAHRLSWEWAHGSIPPKIFVCHHCDIRRCVNPVHLFLGYQIDNSRDAKAKGRHAHGERCGRSKLTAKDVLDIRARASAGERHTIIAQHFQITASNVGAIAKRRSWRHL